MNLHAVLRAAAVSLPALVASTATWAQAPFSSLKLAFTQPTGTADPADAIPVDLTLTNTDATQDFVFDTSLPLSGLNPADVPAVKLVHDDLTGRDNPVAFAGYTPFRLSTGFGCSGTFTSVCEPGAYTFNWANGSPFGSSFQLAAGHSFTYHFGDFVPTAGNAPAGTYEFYRAVLWLDVNGVDADGNALSTVVFPTSTCTADNPTDCAANGDSFFTRTVVATAVPEPGSALLMGLGLAGLAAARRRRN